MQLLNQESCHTNQNKIKKQTDIIFLHKTEIAKQENKTELITLHQYLHYIAVVNFLIEI